MKKFMILFLVGQDRPGIVDDVSTVLYDRGANIEDSRMATLGGCFSIMILFSCLPENLDAVKEGIKELEGMNFETSLHEAHDPEALPRQAEMPLKLEITAMDNPGLVRKVVRILRHYNVNIESLNTRVVKAPLSGAPLFDLDLKAGVPADSSIAAVKKELNSLAEEMNIDLVFRR